MKVNNRLTGISTEILDLMLQKISPKQTINKVKLKPWATAYKIVLKKNNTMLFSTARIKEREKLFKWVGPIMATSIDLITLKQNNSHIDKSNLNNFKIGVILKDVGEELLLYNGVKKDNFVYSVGKQSLIDNIHKLLDHKVDIIANNLQVVKYNAKLHNINSDVFKKVFTLQQYDLYFAFNKNIDDKIIDQYQTILNKIKADGLIEKIKAKYE
jgi:polar amino acid transport system substrate-binding protein